MLTILLSPFGLLTYLAVRAFAREPAPSAGREPVALPGGPAGGGNVRTAGNAGG
ncbi:hypothetical protein [Rhizomonospora bruguierae]|uniref:hypothetical protein n=1 Tax=Rhizomonospora bruguierae TaxID=1581705 RepID=UPI001BD1B8A5|nr:hypothetical protein [Micromonospora sp. NBRC 107566]